MGGEVQSPNWPLPKFHFSVSIPGVGDVAFQEVSGLDIDDVPLEISDGSGRPAGVRKLPGLRKTGLVTFRKGVLPADSAFWDWVKDVKLNKVTAKTLTVSLLDDAGKTTMAWTLANACPIKIGSSDLTSGTHELAVEFVEISHDGVSLSNG